MGSGIPISHQKVVNPYENYMIIRDVFTSPNNLMENSDIQPIYLYDVMRKQLIATVKHLTPLYVHCSIIIVTEILWVSKINCTPQLFVIRLLFTFVNIMQSYILSASRLLSSIYVFVNIFKQLS